MSDPKHISVCMRWLCCMSLLAVMSCETMPFSAMQNKANANTLRHSERIEDGWLSIFGDPKGAQAVAFNDNDWKSVSIPHNWEDYHGYTKRTHGNLHGTAWYRRELSFDPADRDKRQFVRFEGVGSYAKVFMNGTQIGEHAGGRTTFTVDLTDQINWGGRNVLAVRADHPSHIKDLPYVCGGCWGSPNTEGSQPLGIFRPVVLEQTAPVRVVPFGIHAWTPEISEERAVLRVNTEVENHGQTPKSVGLRAELLNADGRIVTAFAAPAVEIAAGTMHTFEQTAPEIANPHLWSTEDPYLHNIRVTVLEDGRPVDQFIQRYGFRWMEWPVAGREGRAERKIDPAKLAEQPGPDNNFFAKRTPPSVGKLNSTSKVRVPVGGLRVTLPEFSADAAKVRVETAVDNSGTSTMRVIVTSFIVNYDGTKFLYSMEDEYQLAGGESHTFVQTSPTINFPELWSPENPYLHMIDTRVLALAEGERHREMKDQMLADRLETTFGIFDTGGLANKGDAYIELEPRVADGDEDRDPRFFLNGKPVFLNGTCEYEHLLGNDHAFTDEQIETRMAQVRVAGFNAFRDAHHPHNLRYLELCDELGILCWTQIGAHIYFDNEAFRDNYRTATREWVRERRNSPSIMLWGLQNESSLPTVFARELTEMIREMDPTSPLERPVNTCNGGTGTDWNIPQNWMGTYGGKARDYGEAFKEQILIGEYGQWRTHGLHQEGDWHDNWYDFGGWERVISEELFSYSLETKVRLAEENKDHGAGHFQWIFNTHANPGRSETNVIDGLAPNDIGVVNYKGVISSWGEPVDAYYMYRANYAPVETDPMVYIVSHTWPDRWDGPGVKDDIVVFSNCDEVELFNDRGGESLGVRQRGPIGTHMEWDGVEIKYDTLYAEGRVKGKVVATDVIKLNNLPPAPRQAAVEAADGDANAPKRGASYVVRMNCGGKDYTDIHGNVWDADRRYAMDPQRGGWNSWAEAYDHLQPEYASQYRTWDPITGTRDDELMQTYRYGRDQLGYRFPVKDGRYVVELYFVEPWFGTGGGMDCTQWRLFDVAINGRTVLDNVDIWSEVGHDTVLKREIEVQVTGGELAIGFPEVRSYHAILSAIAIREGR